MSNFRKHICILLSLLMLAPLTSCSETDKNEIDKINSTESQQSAETNNEISETEKELIKPDIPESADYGGDEILFLYWTNPGWSSTVRESRDIFSEGPNGEGINDAVFNRNVKIEDAYKVKIALEKMNYSSIAGALSKNVKAGDDIYDAVVPVSSSISGIITQGLLHNFHKIPYIDLEKPWWDQDSRTSLTIYGNLPITACALILNDKDGTASVAFNKTIAENYNIEDPYTIVREGNWTYDKLSELADIADQDIDGDGVVTENDIFGFLGGRDVMESFWYGSGAQMSAKTEDGGIEFTFGTERDITSTEKIINLMNQPWFMNHHLIKNTDDIYYRQLFETGHGLFFWMRLDEVTNMRNGEADFGILPIPKYEATQDRYYSMVSRHTSGMLGVPASSSVEKLEEIGLILEAMAAESYHTLIPEYIETSLKTKNSRDSESADMVDIIINNRVFDPMYVYNIGSFCDSFLVLGDNANSNISSILKSKQKVISKQLEKFSKSLQESDEAEK